MENIKVSEETIKEILKDDPLFDIIKNTPAEHTLLNDEYLETIIEKKFYPTVELAHWFGISDGQVRYYIRPFQDYIFQGEDETPSFSTSMRLSFKSILKVRMLILLKDEYKVKGLQQVLGSSGLLIKEDRVTSSTTEVTKGGPSIHDEVQVIKDILNKILQSGAFTVTEKDEKYTVNLAAELENIIEGHQIKALDEYQGKLLTEYKNSLEPVQEEIENLKKQNNKLEDTLRTQDQYKNERNKEETLSFQNEIKSLRKQNQRLETVMQLQRKFEDEAAAEWEKSNSYGLMARLLKANEIDASKRKFIYEYVDKQLKSTLDQTSAE